MKKKTEIAVNTSSGAEKVERIERQTQTPTEEKVEITKKRAQKSAQGEAALGSQKKTVKKTTQHIKQTDKKEKEIVAKKVNAQSTDGKAEKESLAAKARVERALQKKRAQEERKAKREAFAAKHKAEKAKRLAEKKAKIEKRKAEKKAKAEKRAAEKKARAEKRAAEKEARLRARAHAKANKNREKTKRKEEKNSSTENRRKKEHKDHERRNKGYGGWIAAVVSLGVLTLALATTVTVGAIEMNNTKAMITSAYRGTMYELTGLMEHVDEDLDRVRISSTPAQQSRILTDLLVQTRLAELDLEKLPLSAESDKNVTSFINRTARECEGMLNKLRHGGTLSGADFEKLEMLYKTNHEIREQLDELMQKMTDKDMACLIKDGSGAIADSLKGLENGTLAENSASFDKKVDKTDPAGTPRALPAAPDGKGSTIDPVKAEQLCSEYFSEYPVREYQCIGETVTSRYAAYNVQGYDEKGTMLFAEISQKDGALLRFDYFEDCSGETFDVKNAERIAEDFLEKLGYDDMEAVRLRENGSATEFTFVYEDDGVVYYPDEIRVQICRGRGVVTAFDATEFLQNHRGRALPNVKISLEKAQETLHEKLEVEASRLAVVKAVGGERTAYEFFCAYGEDRYFVYLDAVSGEELAIINTKNL